MTDRQRQHPLPLVCVGSCYIPLEKDGLCQAKTREGKKLVCTRREATSKYLTVPLNFGLEMVASFPKSYLWLSEEKKSQNGGAHVAGPLDDVTVYSVKGVSVVQVSDDHKSRPVEYQTCFVSRSSLEDAWKVGRGYLLAATLANRAQIRQKVLNAVHRTSARVAVAGMAGPGPHDGQGRDEDEDGLMEPAEVQQLAAELGMHNGPDDLVGMGGKAPPAIAQFGATMLCGFISVAGPIAQAVGGTLDRIFSAIPVLDRLVLGENVPPRRAPIEELRMSSVLAAAAAQNALAAAGDVGSTTIDQRLSTSALWMGISIQLVLSQYLASTMTTDAASIILASRTPQSKHGIHKRKDPMVMDVFSGLVSSLSASDFFKEATGEAGEHTAGVSAVELEQVLMARNGLEIGYLRRDLKPVDTSVSRGKGVILIGSLGDDHGASETATSIHASGMKAVPPIGVVNAAKLMPRPRHTESNE